MFENKKSKSQGEPKRKLEYGSLIKQKSMNTKVEANAQITKISMTTKVK
jgi:aromatic ring-opening dioxygenase catalytic subunit (LigB family)